MFWLNRGTLVVVFLLDLRQASVVRSVRRHDNVFAGSPNGLT
jgi:hypothetical protein